MFVNFPSITQGSKIVAKQSLKFVPILGWCWSCTETIFVRRVWESDRETLIKDLRKSLADYPQKYVFNVKRPSWFFLFKYNDFSYIV
jgi:1-acyl-sn-glycerol-3-phosphate acyltransferase